MISVGIRELKEKLSGYIGQVRGGEEIVVTDRGREVALLVPVTREHEAAESLVREGRASWGGGKPLGGPGVPGDSKVSDKGQVLIPAPLRKRHRLAAGTRVRFFEYGELICLMPVVNDPVGAALGSLAGEKSLADDLLAERARDDR